MSITRRVGIGVLLSGALALSLSGCGSAEPTAGPDTPTVESEYAPTAPGLSAGQLDGLRPTQASHLNTIIQVGQERGLDDEVIVTAVAVAITESGLMNLSSIENPNSLSNHPNDGPGNTPGVGLYGVVPQDWDTMIVEMDPKTATESFFDRLQGTDAVLSPGERAVLAQRSALSSEVYERSMKPAASLVGQAQSE